MTTEYFISYILIFSAVFCMMIFVGTLSRSKNLAKHKNLPFFFYIFQGAISFFSLEIGSSLTKKASKHRQKIETMLRQADLPLQVQDMYGASVVLAIVGMVIGIIFFFMTRIPLPVKVLMVLVFICLGAFYSFFSVYLIAQKRREEILRDLPFVIDIVSSSMNAGLDFNASIAHLGEIKSNEHTVLKDEFMSYLKEVQLGKSRAEALRDMEKKNLCKRIQSFHFCDFAWY